LLQITVEPLYKGSEKNIRHQLRANEHASPHYVGNLLWENKDVTCFVPDPAYYERFKAKKTGLYPSLSFLT
jgi:hypothetical protein